MFTTYDIIVVGAGHAGCEAAASSAQMGARVLLVTMNMATIAQMSCNPAMGGIAKGQILREIDALGGLSGIVTDQSMIQFRMLNRSKGPAMWSPRSQNDRMLFAQKWRLELEKIENLDFWQEMVTGLLVEKQHVVGVTTGMGHKIYGKSVILTNGTFLNGIIHVGEKQFGGGRTGESPARGITESLVSMGFEYGRMKTGTPPRVDGRSLNYEAMEVQPGDAHPGKFSFTDTQPLTEQRSCHITYTNPSVHALLKTGFDQSPMFTGRIKGQGPRYCPSIEDKINRFSDRDRHQIFVEPEGWDTIEVYVNGFSTSLPEKVQFEALKKISGFENVKMFRPGYAIEYDFFPPTQLKLTLETQRIENLYFAVQINGTTGYEEAASQGLMAGINAVNKIRNNEPFVLKRSEAYIGVLIDDLINKGTDEPYRMFTSRAEYRILLRQDNADLRLTRKGYDLGLASKDQLDRVVKKEGQINQLLEELKSKKVNPSSVNKQIIRYNTSPLKEGTNIEKLIKRPEIGLDEIKLLSNDLANYLDTYDREIQEQAEIQIKYATYIEKEFNLAKKIESLDLKKIKSDFDYDMIKALSVEAREKLKKIRPENLGQASRISGVSPADVSVLMVYLNR